MNLKLFVVQLMFVMQVIEVRLLLSFHYLGSLYIYLKMNKTHEIQIFVDNMIRILDDFEFLCLKML